ncbi:LacI family DNA-binding transcriptional regulator [Paenibacillus sedimenti]|uniref:LacI family DNA-binding transcriptional regulator n=1 Tax=Paenibacillus sedimenti TaxID=2770274 RepID=A0A926QJY2_9BACL|nr:LacI family DNA-binding transcriptional regulator [Paenibacillus sedimenti]MBD0380934.1 LacI family DNA-binding transcriptional regulator [Paenibacillus sedimenti]
MNHITVYDIAKEANVSVSTVSRVLNDTAPVKKSTKDKIMQIIDKYQFQPNALARSLLKKETGTIGMIMPDITNPFFPEVFLGAESEARIKGYTFFLCNTSGDSARESEYLSILSEKRVDGIIFMGGRINLARCKPELVKEVTDISSRIPVVLVNGQLPNSNIVRVSTDEAKGARLVTQHLIDLGHKDIGFIGGVDHMSTTIQKVKAFKSQLEDSGLVYQPDWVLHGSFSVRSGEELMKKMIEMKKRPTAIFCVNDFTAVGAIKAVSEHGMKIPDDFSIVGFDDTPLATSIIPEMTTVSQKSHELGKTAVQILTKLLNKEKVKRLTLLEPELMIRKSTGRLKN